MHLTTSAGSHGSGGYQFIECSRCYHLHMGNGRPDVLQLKDAWFGAITMPSGFSRQLMWFQAQLLHRCLLNCLSFLRPAKSKKSTFLSHPD